MDKRITVVIESSKAKKIIELQTIIMKKNQESISFGKALNLCLDKGIDQTLKRWKKK
jgi:hypothetical protein